MFCSGSVEFSVFGFVIALAFGGSEAVVYRYRYTNNPVLEGQAVAGA